MSDLNMGELGAAPAVVGESVRGAVAPPEVIRGAAPADQVGLDLGVVEDADGLDALEEEWNLLLERCEASVFQSFEWQRTWWRHFGEERDGLRLHVVTLRSPAGLVAIAPFYVERVKVLGVLELRRLLFLGHRDSDYLDLLVMRGREADCVERIAAHLSDRAQDQPVDVVILEEIPDRSPTIALLQDALRRRGWAASRLLEGQCPRTLLASTWEETVARFSINYRREIRRRLRNIAKTYRIELEVVPPDAEIEPAMRDFIAMHQERWLRDGFWGAFADPGTVAFHCDVAQRLSRRGWLFLAFLRANGERCAANYGFRFRNVVSTYLGGARESPELRRYSPGRVLNAKSMEWGIEHGYTTYDFMRGTEHYKYEFDAIDVPNWTLLAYPRRPALAAAKHRMSAFLSALRRRARREAQAAVATARQAGWLSRPMLGHLGRRIRRGVTDVFVRLRRRAGPERNRE